MSADEAVDATRHEDNQLRMTELEGTVAGLAADVHAMKGSLAANTSFSREAAEGIAAIKALIAQLDIPSLRDMGEVMTSMRGGVRVLGWLERPAKWVMAIAGAAAALYGLWKLK